MSHFSLDDGCLELGVPVLCGGGKHEVLLEVTPVAARVVFNPCDALTPRLRRLTRRSCDESLPEILEALERRLQHIWCDDAGAVRGATGLPTEVRRQIDEFVKGVRKRKESIAERWLVAFEVGRRDLKFDKDVLQAEPLAEAPLETVARRLDRFDPHAVTWARLVLARDDRTAARGLLKKAGDMPVAILLAGLCAVDWGEDPFALSLLQQAVLDSRIVPTLRARFARMLGTRGDAGHAVPLVDAMTGWRSEDAEVRAAAGDGLRRLVARLAGVGDARSPQGMAGLRDVLRLTFEHGFRQRCTDALANCLAGVGGVIFGHLVEFLECDHNAACQSVAIRVLGRMPDLRAFDVLLQTVSGPRAALREAATGAIVGMAGVLARLGDEAVPRLTELANSGAGPMLSVFALDTLGIIGSPLAIDTLAELARTAAGSGLRVAALETLGRGDQPRNVEKLLSYLERPRPEFRSIALEALASAANRLARADAALPGFLRTLSAHEDDDGGPGETDGTRSDGSSEGSALGGVALKPTAAGARREVIDVAQIRLRLTDSVEAVNTLLDVAGRSRSRLRRRLLAALRELHTRETGAGGGR